jgi:hypothetical protein
MEQKYYKDPKLKVNVPVEYTDKGELCKYHVVDSNDAKQAAAYLSFLNDLNECEKYLNILKPMIKDDTILVEIKTGLFFFAVIAYARCFNKGAGRGEMLQKNVFKGNPQLLVEHTEVMTMRNQYIAHAGNSKHENRSMVLYFDPNGFRYDGIKPKLGINKHLFDHDLDKYYRLISATREFINAELPDRLRKYEQSVMKLDLPSIYIRAKAPDPNNLI